jgi:hypothetical protein
MSTELAINFGLVNLKVDLGEFLAVARQIAGVVQQQETRAALKAGIVEIRKSCDTAVDVFTPLYALTSEVVFGEKFGTLHDSFKNSYMKNVDGVRTRCHLVKAHMDVVLEKKEWQAGLPLLERSYRRLQELCNNWLYSDFALAQQMESLFRDLDTFYTDIAALAGQDQAAAFALLSSGRGQFEDDFLSLRKQLDALDVLSAKL